MQNRTMLAAARARFRSPGVFASDRPAQAGEFCGWYGTVEPSRRTVFLRVNDVVARLGRRVKMLCLDLNAQCVAINSVACDKCVRCPIGNRNCCCAHGRAVADLGTCTPRSAVTGPERRALPDVAAPDDQVRLTVAVAQILSTQ